jgi:aspartyl protease family protein
MKVVTIGRSADNDITVNDGKVSRHHLQIIRDETGNFRAVDFGSTNGTFVNDRKISGEIVLSYNDAIRIGNTNLPWRSYFSGEVSAAPQPATKKLTPWILGAAGAAAVAAVFILVFAVGRTPDNVVKMREENGVRYIPAKVNGQELDFVFDTGASSICISTLEVAILAKNGLLSDEDFIGKESFRDATGRISVGAKFNLKTVKIGNRELSNVEATVIENPRAECLLGQSVLAQFGAYTIDNDKKEIRFK